jgi:PAS domain S-box-containing protein
MPIPLLALMIEDTPADADLALWHLQKAGYQVTSQRIETAEAMIAALDAASWDIIVSDYSLPLFSAPEALKILQGSGKDIPFIIISGTITEETAIELMRDGAADYLLKDRLARLGPLVRRELNLAQVRKERAQAQAELQKSLNWSDRIYNATSDFMFLLSVEPGDIYRCLTVNAAFLKSTGVEREQVIGKRAEEILQPQMATYILKKYKEAIQAGHAIRYEESIEVPRGTVTVETTLTPIFDSEGTCTHLHGSAHEITDRKQAEQLLHDSEEKFRQFVERSNDAFYRQNFSTGRIEYVSPKIKEIIGYSPEELMAMGDASLMEIFHPDDQPLLLQFSQDLIATDASGQGHIEREFRLRDRQGEYHWIHGNFALVRAADQQPLAFIGSLSDITRHKQAEKILHEEEIYLRTVVETTREGFLMLQGDGKIIDANQAYCDLSGYSLDELKNLEIHDLDAVEDLPATIARNQHIIQKGAERFETRHRRKDGTIFDVEVSATYIPEGGGRIISFCRDIQERKQAEERLRLSEAKFSTVFRVSPDAIHINCLEDGRYIEINEGFTTFTGYTSEDVAGKTSLEINFWNDPQDRQRLVNELQIQGKVENLEALFRCKDGTVKTGLMSACVIEINGEKCILSVTRDITDRKQAEQALRESEFRYRTFFERGGDGVVILNPEDGKILEFNDVACRQLGYSREEFARLHVSDIEEQESPEDVRQHIQKILESGTDIFETRHRTRQGEIRSVHVTAQVIPTVNQPIYHCIWRDITDQNRAQEEILRSEEALARQNNLLNTLLENLPIGIFMVEAPSGKPLVANEKAYKLLGRGILPDATRRNLAEVYEAYRLPDLLPYPPEEMPIVRGMNGERTHVDDMLVVRPDSSTTLLDVIGSPLLDAEGKIWASMVTFQDITLRKQAEDALATNEQRLRHLVESTHDWIWEVDQNGVYVYASPRCQDILGYSPEEILGKTPFDLMPPEESERVGAIFRTLVAERKPFSRLENSNRHKDGHFVILETNGVPILDHAGQLVGYRGMDRDITERRTAEEKLKEQLDELRRWHAVTLGREKRVLELKAEVNQLLQNAGLPRRYASVQGSADELNQQILSENKETPGYDA